MYTETEWELGYWEGTFATSDQRDGGGDVVVITTVPIVLCPPTVLRLLF